MGLITKYSTSIFAGGSESNLQCNAIINCYNDSQLTPVMTAYFYHEGYFIPPNSKHIDRVNLRFSISEYSCFLDLLRHEEPVYYSYNEHSKIGYIRTGQELNQEVVFEEKELASILK